MLRTGKGDVERTVPHGAEEINGPQGAIPASLCGVKGDMARTVPRAYNGDGERTAPRCTEEVDVPPGAAEAGLHADKGDTERTVFRTDQGDGERAAPRCAEEVLSTAAANSDRLVAPLP